MRPSNNLKNKTTSDTYWRAWLIWKVRLTVLSSDHRPDTFDESRFILTFLIILGVTEILCSFRFIPEGNIGKEMSESSWLEFLENFLANNFALSDAEHNTSEPTNRGVMADLPLLIILLAIYLKSPQCLVLGKWWNFLQWLLACLNFILDSEDLFCWCKRKKWFLWTMAPAKAVDNQGDAWGLTWYTMRVIYINFNLNPLTKFNSSSRSTKFKDILTWNISQTRSRWWLKHLHAENLR